MFFEGIFFVKMQAQRRALGPKNSQKTSFEDQNWILSKIFNDKNWPQLEDVFWNLRNLEKVKSYFQKMKFHYVVSYFEPILKEFCTKATENFHFRLDVRKLEPENW